MLNIYTNDTLDTYTLTLDDQIIAIGGRVDIYEMYLRLREYVK